MASTSHKTPFGRSLTATQERAGALTKYVCQETGGLDHGLKGCAACCQNSSYVLAGLLCLLCDGCARYLASCRDYRNLAGRKYHISKYHTLGVWTDCCRCFCCYDLLHVFFLLILFHPAALRNHFIDRRFYMPLTDG